MGSSPVNDLFYWSWIHSKLKQESKNKSPRWNELIEANLREKKENNNDYVSGISSYIITPI